MTDINIIKDLFKAIDKKVPTDFCRFLTEDCTFIFANYPPVTGKSNIEQFLDGFYKSIQSLQHDVKQIIESNNKIFSSGIVTYTRLNGSQLTVKFCNIFTMENDLIHEYDIYVDASQLYTE